ncbi:hypothetical protein DA798_03120 [Lactobacillus sp. PFC-70]|nr:hypothetical protein DA798_03120 [Lactobacillus sp. PFC-70]
MIGKSSFFDRLFCIATGCHFVMLTIGAIPEFKEILIFISLGLSNYHNNKKYRFKLITHNQFKATFINVLHHH